MAENQALATDELEGDDLSSPGIVTYKTPSGQLVTLSQEAMDAYGEAYINQAALATGKNKVLFADENLLEYAQSQFPDSDTPLIDAYPDYMPSGDDLLQDMDDMPQKILGMDREEFRNGANEKYEEQVKDNIESNSPGALAKPLKDSALIIIPSPSSLSDNEFKDGLISGLSSLDIDKFGAMPGNSMDWAKFAISHEIGHIVGGHSDQQFQRIIDSMKSGNLASNVNSINENRMTIKGEIEADISAARDFNIVSGAIPPIPQAFADLRIINSVMSKDDVITLGGNGKSLDDHNTGNALQDYLDGKDLSGADPDKIQFNTAYTNTLIYGFIGAADGESSFEDRKKRFLPGYEDNPLRSLAGGIINKDGFEQSMQGNDPMKLVSLGKQLSKNSPEEVYAATKALYESGEFDHSPETKKSADRFIKAIERSAPGIVNQEMVDKYRDAASDPANKEYLQHLHRYNTPDNKIGYLYQPSPQAPSPNIQP
ncbi:MAG: hypothetical protein DI586_07890 [Micavibrio aeruginosavorus]|uniref:Uncharacterized protein n=1 Tax=Micavibrio aeruginosavorus TaxID=349221 RepID=A0A2W5FGR8_9BACT|nr:MAG: hypothetical protein DI586_07890 [Micavibrio aeruginosavorus]